MKSTWRCQVPVFTLSVLTLGLKFQTSDIANPRQPQHRKLALIVAIGAYPPPAQYPKINSDNDIPLVRGALLTAGFDSTNIRVLQDAAATREGILGGLQRLIDQAEPGDVVVFHYSGHGHRITDDDGDELDGYDQLLVPYGAPGNLDAGDYRGERHIRDDELVPLTTALRRKVGPSGSVLILIDACFSGSATRGVEELPVRGILQPIQNRSGAPTSSPGRTPQKKYGSGLFNQDPATLRGESPFLAPMVVISASGHAQLSHETYDDQRRPVGALSLALSRALPKIDGTTTYRSLFDRIAVAMAAMDLHGQQPQLEGAVDTKVFSGQVVRQTPYFKVTKTMGDISVVLNGGTLLGLLPQTEIAFLPTGTMDPDGIPPLATGVVRSATETAATVMLAGSLPDTDLGISWAFVTRYAYGDLRVRVRVGRTLEPATRASVRAALGNLPIVELVESSPDLLVSALPLTRGAPGESNVRKIAITTIADNAPVGGPIDATTDSTSTAILQAVRDYARSRYIRKIDLVDPRIRVTMELIPTNRRIGDDSTCQGTDTLPVAGKRDAGNQWRLHPHDVFLLRIRNEGEDDAYISILDLPPGGAVGQLFPMAGNLGSDNSLPAHKSLLIEDMCYEVTEPYGVEVLKLFATREPIDFTSVLVERRRVTRGEALSPLQELMGDAYGGTRSTGYSAPRGTGSTFGITFNVVPR